MTSKLKDFLFYPKIFVPYAKLCLFYSPKIFNSLRFWRWTRISNDPVCIFQNYKQYFWVLWQSNHSLQSLKMNRYHECCIYNILMALLFYIWLLERFMSSCEYISQNCILINKLKQEKVKFLLCIFFFCLNLVQAFLFA